MQGAKVSIVEQATSEPRDLITNERGEFNAPSLRVGQYSVTVTMAGFKTEIHSGIVLKSIRCCICQSRCNQAE